MPDAQTTNYDEQLQRLLQWCEQHGLTVKLVDFSKNPIPKFSDNEHYDTDTNTVYLGIKRSSKHKLWILLHECGHYHIHTTPVLNAKFSTLLDKTTPRTLTEQANALEEEVLAWHFGEELAASLGLTLTDNYRTYKAMCLKSYITSSSKLTQ